MNRHAVAAVSPYPQDLKHVCDTYRHYNPQAWIRKTAANSLFGLSAPGAGLDPLERDVVASWSSAEGVA